MNVPVVQCDEQCDPGGYGEQLAYRELKATATDRLPARLTWAAPPAQGHAHIDNRSGDEEL